MGRLAVYITPFHSNGTYGDEVEVTNDVISVGKIDVDTDSSEYQIGLFRVANVKLDLANQSGRYSDVGAPNSIFKTKRKDSLVRVTWIEAPELPYCGTAICGEAVLCEERTLFEGLLNDDAFVIDAQNDRASFVVLGFQSLFESTEVPFESLDVADTMSDIIFAILDQVEITGLLTLDADNIDLDVDQIPDNIDELETLSVKEALDRLLLLSNSVLYIENRTIYIKPRDPSASVEFTFYGQASTEGAENIVDLTNYNNGRQRVFNCFKWSDTLIRSQDGPSIRLNGFRKRVIDSDIFTNSTKQLNVLSALLEEFVNPKQELQITTLLTEQTVLLELLDRVAIDYPVQLVPYPGTELPICGVAICGEAVLPKGLWNIKFETSTNFKILKKSIDPIRSLVTFKLREV